MTDTVVLRLALRKRKLTLRRDSHAQLLSDGIPVIAKRAVETPHLRANGARLSGDTGVSFRKNLDSRSRISGVGVIANCGVPGRRQIDV
jgi:hypothetical protein